MNRLEVCRLVADTKKVPVLLVMRLLDAMTDDVVRVWSESGAVTWPRFGTWYARQRKARLVRHWAIQRKRAAKPGESASDPFMSVVPAGKDLVFSPSLRFAAKVSGRKVTLPVSTYGGAGAEWADRIAARVGLAGVEVEGVLSELLDEVARQVTRGVEIRIDNFGVLYSKRRGGRYYNVPAKGGAGRRRVYVGGRNVPAYKRDVSGA